MQLLVGAALPTLSADGLQAAFAKPIANTPVHHAAMLLMVRVVIHKEAHCGDYEGGHRLVADLPVVRRFRRDTETKEGIALVHLKVATSTSLGASHRQRAFRRSERRGLHAGFRTGCLPAYGAG